MFILVGVILMSGDRKGVFIGVLFLDVSPIYNVFYLYCL